MKSDKRSVSVMKQNGNLDSFFGMKWKRKWVNFKKWKYNICHKLSFVAFCSCFTLLRRTCYLISYYSKQLITFGVFFPLSVFHRPFKNLICLFPPAKLDSSNVVFVTLACGSINHLLLQAVCPALWVVEAASHVLSPSY